MVTPMIKAITLIKTIITKITTNNYKNSINKKKKKKRKGKKKSPYIQKSLSSKTYQSYKTTDAQHIGSKMVPQS